MHMGLNAQGLWSQSFSMLLVHLVGHRNKKNGRPTADWNGDVRCTRKRKDGCSAIMTRNNQCGPGWAQQQHVASGEPSIPPMIRLPSRGSTTHVREQRPGNPTTWIVGSRRYHSQRFMDNRRPSASHHRNLAFCLKMTRRNLFISLAEYRLKMT